MNRNPGGLYEQRINLGLTTGKQAGTLVLEQQGACPLPACALSVCSAFWPDSLDSAVDQCLDGIHESLRDNPAQWCSTSNPQNSEITNTHIVLYHCVCAKSLHSKKKIKYVRLFSSVGNMTKRIHIPLTL